MHTVLSDVASWIPIGDPYNNSGRSLGTDGSNEAFERAKVARKILRARAVRAEYLSSRLFSEPAWDMLLELYVAHLLQRRLSVSDLCIASRVPQTTALRSLEAIFAEELASRRRDPLDGRRVFIELTPKGSAALEQYFESLFAAKTQPRPVAI